MRHLAFFPVIHPRGRRDGVDAHAKIHILREALLLCDELAARGPARPGLAGRPPSIADARHRLGEREDHVRRSSAPLDTSLALHDDRDLPLGGALGDDADVQVGLGEGAHEAGRHAGPHRHALAYDRDNENVGEAYRVHVRAGELELERGPQGAAQRHG